MYVPYMRSHLALRHGVYAFVGVDSYNCYEHYLVGCRW